MKKRKLKILLISLTIISFLAMSVFFLNQMDWKSGTTVDPLQQLSIRLNAKYWRSLEENKFSLNYVPLPPNTIVIKIRTTSGADMTQVNEIARAAQNLVTHYARDEFKLSVSTQVDLQPLAPSPTN